MSKNFVEAGGTINFIAPAGGVISGQAFLIGVMLVIAISDVPENQAGAGEVEGVFDIPKATGVVNQGAKLYWDDTAKKLTTTVSSNTLIGVAWRSALSGALTVQCKINI